MKFLYLVQSVLLVIGFVSLTKAEEIVSCSVLQAPLLSDKMQVMCGGDPENTGWIADDTPVRTVAMRVRDKNTGEERVAFEDVSRRRGGYWESFGANKTGRFSGLPIALYVPGGCGSSAIFHKLTLGVYKNNNELKTEEECSWLGEYDTTWRKPVQKGAGEQEDFDSRTRYTPLPFGVSETEDIIEVRYHIPPDTSIYEKNITVGKGPRTGVQYVQERSIQYERKGTVGMFNKQTPRDELSCSATGAMAVFSASYGSNECAEDKLQKLCMNITGYAWCSASNRREYYEFPYYGCKALEDGTCPDTKECIFGEGSIFVDPELSSTQLINPLDEEVSTVIIPKSGGVR